MKKLISGPGFNHLVEARHGYVLYNVNDRYVGRSIEHYGEWSPGETALFAQFCRSGRNGWWRRCWPRTSRSTV